MSKPVGPKGGSLQFRDFVDPVKDLRDERILKAGLIASGILVVIGACLCIYLSSTGKIGHHTSTYKQFDYQSLSFRNVSENWVGFNYAAFSFGVGGGVVLIIVGARYNKESSLRPYEPKSSWSGHEVTIEKIRVAASLSDLYQLLSRYPSKGDPARRTNLGSFVRDGTMTEAQVRCIDKWMEKHFTLVTQYNETTGKAKTEIERRYGLTFAALVTNENVTGNDRAKVTQIQQEDVAFEAAKENLNQGWQKEGSPLMNPQAANVDAGSDSDL